MIPGHIWESETTSLLRVSRESVQANHELSQIAVLTKDIVMGLIRIQAATFQQPPDAPQAIAAHLFSAFASFPSQKPSLRNVLPFQKCLSDPFTNFSHSSAYPLQKVRASTPHTTLHQSIAAGEMKQHRRHGEKGCNCFKIEPARLDKVGLRSH